MRGTAPGFFFVMRVLTGLVGVGTPLLLARTMDVADFATYATIMATASLAIMISSLGIDRACLRLLPPYAGVASLSTLMRFLAMITVPRMLALCLALLVAVWSGLWLPSGAEAGLGVSKSHAALLLALLGLTMGTNQLAASFIQGLLLHRAYAVIIFLSVLVRIGALTILILVHETLTFDRVIEVFILTESAALLAQTTVIGWSAHKSHGTGEQALAPHSMAEVLSISKANYLTYLVALPWSGPALILLVGNFCSHEVTAAFAFFQTLAERARMFMPVRLLRSFVEPLWAKQHQREGRVKRLQAPLASLQKVEVLLLSLALAWIVAAGEPALRHLIRPQYANQLHLLELIVIQQAIGSMADLLWMGMNATNQIALFARVLALVSLGSALFLIPAVLLGGVVGVIVLACVPPVALLVTLRRTDAQFARLALQSRKTVWFLFLGGAAGAIGWMVQVLLRPGAAAIAVALLLGTIAWLVMVAWTKPFNRAERHLLKLFVYSRT